jgi:hypothetical protein
VTLILPRHFADKVASMPEFSYGANRVRVRLRSGVEFTDVFIAWSKEIVRVGSSANIPFVVSEIADIENQP